MSPYRDAPAPRARDACVLVGRLPRVRLVGVAALWIASLVVLAFRGSPVTCERNGAASVCHAAGRSYALADVFGLRLESRDVVSLGKGFRQEHVVASRLVLETSFGPTPIEDFSTYQGDPRAALVRQFDAFLAGHGGAFPGPLYGLKTYGTALGLFLLGGWLLRSAIQRRRIVRLAIDQGRRVLLLTRVGTGAWTGTLELPLSTAPTLTTREQGAETFLCLMQDGVATPLVDVPRDLTSQAALIRQVDALLLTAAT